MFIYCLEMLIRGVKVTRYIFYIFSWTEGHCGPRKVILSPTITLEERMQGYEGVHASCRYLHSHLWADQYNQSFTRLPFKPVQFDLKKKKKMLVFTQTSTEFLSHSFHIFLGNHLWISTHSCRPTSITSDVTAQADTSTASNGVMCCWDVGGGRKREECRACGEKAVTEMFVPPRLIFYPPWRVEINTTLSWSCSW